MRLKIPNSQVAALREALTRAGENEIGGQIFGEQLAPSQYLASELTFQKRRGTIARFVVDLIQAAKDAVRFYDKTRHRYERFNYIGEWHSHPSFDVHPSDTDVETMRRLVCDQDFKGQFAVLMIVRLATDSVQLGAWNFDTEGREFQIRIEECE